MAELTHIAFILDGHRRWAKAHNLPALEGHRVGYENIKSITELCFERGIKYVSAYAFSTENWKRSKTEVNYLMKLTERILAQDIHDLDEKNIRLRFIGSRTELKPKLVAAIERAEKQTASNDGGTFCVCFNYGGRDEIVKAARELVRAKTKPEDVTEASLKSQMYSADIPDPDLIVRTSGEQRLSNFLLWGSAYAELMFLPMPWPDFHEAELTQVIADYQARNRRYGK